MIASFAQAFSVRFPILSYKGWLRVTTILSFTIANFGFDTIISWTMPTLMLLYPLAMAMILPALCSGLFKNRKIVYQMTTLFTVIPALLDGIKALPVQNSFTSALTSWYTHTIPFAANGLGLFFLLSQGSFLGCFFVYLKKTIRIKKRFHLNKIKRLGQKCLTPKNKKKLRKLLFKFL